MRRFNPRFYERRYKELRESGDILTDYGEKGRVMKYLKRARLDLLLARVLLKISSVAKFKGIFGIRPDYSFYNWVIITSYYGMYHAATAAIARKDTRAKSHIATISALAKHYTLANKLDKEYIHILEEAYIISIDSSRVSRTIAQYNIDVEFERKEAEDQIKRAEDFIRKMEDICI